MKSAKDVDEYIASAPKEAQSKLRQLRTAIKTAAPNAKEKISYGMPYYLYKGRLAYFAAFKSHISLFAIPPFINEHKDQLKKFVSSKSTIQFPLDQKLPLGLIKKLVRAQIKKKETEKK